MKNTPPEPIHCIVWSKQLFAQHFGTADSDKDVSPNSEDPELKEKESALGKALHLQRELEVMGGGPYLHAVKRVSELKTLSVNILKALEHQLKKDLDEIDKVKARVLSSWNILYLFFVLDGNIPIFHTRAATLWFVVSRL